MSNFYFNLPEQLLNWSLHFNWWINWITVKLSVSFSSTKVNTYSQISQTVASGRRVKAEEVFGCNASNAGDCASGHSDNKSVGERSRKTEYHLHQWSERKPAFSVHTDFVSMLKWIMAHSQKNKHSPGFWTVNNRAVKNSHISLLCSSVWLWVSQQHYPHYTTTWSLYRKKLLSRTNQLHPCQGRGTALHHPHRGTTVTLHGTAVAW